MVRAQPVGHEGFSGLPVYLLLHGRYVVVLPVLDPQQGKPIEGLLHKMNLSFQRRPAGRWGIL